jgi:hypothetical protein
MPKIGFSRNYFTEEKSMDSVHEPWTMSGLGPRAVDHVRPRSTVDRPWTAAPSSSELRPPAVPVSRGGRGGVECEELDGRLTGARAAAGHRGGAEVVRGAQWGGALAWERRRGELGEGRDVPGVLGGGGGLL